MIYYLITPILQWIKKKPLKRNVGIVVLIAAISTQIILAYTTDIGMVAGHTLSWCVFALGMYVVGYFVGNIILSDYMGKTRIIALSMLAVIVSGIVLFFNIKFDEQVIYDRIVVCYGMIVIGLWISIVHGLLIAAVSVNILDKFGALAYILSTLVLSWIVAVVFHWIINRIKIHKVK